MISAEGFGSTRGHRTQGNFSRWPGVLEARGTQVMKKRRLTVQSSGGAVHSLVPAVKRGTSAE